MKDSENLTKLLNGSSPHLFRLVITLNFDVKLPEIEPDSGKRSIRNSFKDVICNISQISRKKINEWAEKINLLTDAVGRDVMESIRYDQLDKSKHEEFDQLANQFDRSLWLLNNELILFNEALDRRLADIFRQKKTCYTDFDGPKNVPLKQASEVDYEFHDCIADYINRPRDQVAISTFNRIHPDSETGEDVSLFQICIHHNLAPEVIECVKQSQLDSMQITRAVCAYITYEPSTGKLSVLSKDNKSREGLARIAADSFLESPISGEKIPLKQYEYQFLAEPFLFDIAGENIEWVKVTELSYKESGRTLSYKIGAKCPDDIYESAKQDIAPQFSFANHFLSTVEISVRFRKTASERSRTEKIVLKNESGCNISAKREKDRVVCERLLRKWGIVKEVDDEHSIAANDS